MRYMSEGSAEINLKRRWLLWGFMFYNNAVNNVKHERKEKCWNMKAFSVVNLNMLFTQLRITLKVNLAGPGWVEHVRSLQCFTTNCDAFHYRSSVTHSLTRATNGDMTRVQVNSPIGALTFNDSQLREIWLPSVPKRQSIRHMSNYSEEHKKPFSKLNNRKSPKLTFIYGIYASHDLVESAIHQTVRRDNDRVSIFCSYSLLVFASLISPWLWLRFVLALPFIFLHLPALRRLFSIIVSISFDMIQFFSINP